MIPFFVLDRPVSLEILKDFFANNLEHQFGILTHAFTSSRFKEKFRNFPFDTPLRYSNLQDTEELNEKISKNIIKFVDSGIFQSQRNISYKELFGIYEYLNADYGIIIDFLKDRKETIKSAKEAIKIYKEGNYSFKLVGVAQGYDLKDYLKCYEELKNLGYEYIAIGGLLKRNENSNYIRLSCEMFLIELLENISKEFNPDWIFTLGIYSPKRHKLLEDYNVWGADYKGWLFEYEEDYSFIISYLEEYNLSQANRKRIEKALEAYIREKSLLKLNSKGLDRNDLKKRIRKIRRILDKLLKKENLSLQEFRFRRVRESLTRNLVDANFKASYINMVEPNLCFVQQNSSY